MNIVFIDACVSDRCFNALTAFDLAVIRMPAFAGLSAPIASHPDIVSAVLPDGRLLVNDAYAPMLEKAIGEGLSVIQEERGMKRKKETASPFPFFEAEGSPFVLTDERPSSPYPSDVLFDALAVGDSLYGHPTATSRVLREAYPRFVPTRQGYARCSVAMLSPTCAVTSDLALGAQLRADGIEVLTIRPGHIRLPGYDTGFIGGAGGRLPDGRYAFFGDLMLHPDGEAIAAFAHAHKIKTVSLAAEPLSDNGGMVVLSARTLRVLR